MTAIRLKILIVDDYEDNCDLLEDIFESDYDVSCVNSGQECLNTLEEQSVDLVLLDINMPQMDGYEVCRRLKENPATALTPIIFVSALASTEERLKGYELGAEEYVTKPFKGDDIKATVEKVLESRIQTFKVEEQSKLAMSTAFQAMSTSAELGLIIQYMKQTYECKNTESLANKLQETLDQFGLSSCLMFRMEYQTTFFGCKPDSIEAKVLERFYSTERILDFGARTLINDNHISILIRNMPLDKPEDYGRIKDNLVALLAGTQARCEAIDIENQLDISRRQGLRLVLENSQKTLAEIREIISQQKSKTTDVLLSVNKKIESIIFTLGLDENQERTILSTVDQSVDEISKLTHFSETIESQFHNFVEDLQNLSNE